MKNQTEDASIEILSKEYFSINLPPNIVVELDLGCGKGNFTIQLAMKYPERSILAADIMIGRLRKLAQKAFAYKISNIRPFKVEAWQLFGMCLPDNSIDRLHILCPDPWPKERHRSHKLLSSEFIGRIYTKLKRQGVLHFSTDDKSYFEFVVNNIEKSGLFEKNEKKIKDIIDLKTDFEKRWNKLNYKVNHMAWISSP